MAVVQTAMLAEFSFTVLRDAIFTHPTMAEGLNPLFSSIQPVNASETKDGLCRRKMTLES